MNRKKLLYLFLALLLPVVVFLFLKSFGRNEFSVPPLHQDSIPELASDCHYKYELPYRVPDSVMTLFAGNTRDSIYVLFFDSTAAPAIGRVESEFRGEPVTITEGTSLGSHEDLIRKCILLLDEPASVVLVDHKKRIRGYYDPHDREDMDRLIVEMKIILKQY